MLRCTAYTGKLNESTSTGNTQGSAYTHSLHSHKRQRTSHTYYIQH